MVTPLATDYHVVPSQWRSVPLSPTAHASVEAFPQTPLRFADVLTVTVLHAVPSQWTTAPPTPTPHTSAEALPQRPRSCDAGSHPRTVSPGSGW